MDSLAIFIITAPSYTSLNLYRLKWIYQMLTTLFKTTLSISLLLSSTLASASLITNGSFEKLVFSDNSTSQSVKNQNYLHNFGKNNKEWNVFYTLPGWVTTAGSGIELQKNVVSKSADGTNHVELDSISSKSNSRGSSNSVMTQSLDSLTIGAEYLLEFSYKPRSHKKNDNGINVFWYDSATDFNLAMDADYSINKRKTRHTDWAVQSMVFTAQSENMDLSFGAFGKQNTRGGLVDNVSLVKMSNGPVAEIPEPSVFALSLLGFAALARRQQKKTK